MASTFAPASADRSAAFDRLLAKVDVPRIWLPRASLTTLFEQLHRNQVTMAVSLWTLIGGKFLRGELPLPKSRFSGSTA